jgi:hypothetical protein
MQKYQIYRAGFFSSDLRRDGVFFPGHAPSPASARPGTPSKQNEERNPKRRKVDAGFRAGHAEVERPPDVMVLYCSSLPPALFLPFCLPDSISSVFFWLPGFLLNFVLPYRHSCFGYLRESSCFSFG